MFAVLTGFSQSVRSRLILIIAICFSLVFTLLHAGPINNTLPALLIVVVLQLYLPGWLLLNGLRIHTSSNPVVRFAWILTVGLSLTIPLAGLFRVLLWPVESYLLALHTLMFVLVFFQKHSPEQIDWGALKRHWYFYGALTVFCFIGFVVGIDRSQVRLNSWDDQTVFIMPATWLAHAPPNPALPSRSISSFTIERYRWVTDGWTYQHAAWEWITGIPSATVIWYLITPLFSWVTPILTFALAYELSRREKHAFYCAAGLTIASLFTIEGLVYSSAFAYGQAYFAQMNSLRQFSSAIMLPLTLMVGIAYLRQPQKQKALIVLLALITLGILHPRQITIAAISFGAFSGLIWLIVRTRARFYIVLSLILMVILCLAIPLAQRALLKSEGAAAGVDVADTQALEDDLATTSASGALINGLVKVGNFLVIDPHAVFYNPLVIIATILGFAMPLWGWKRPENLFPFGITLAMLLLLFTPGLAGIFIKVVTPRIAASFSMMLPISIILGTTLDHVLRLLHSRKKIIEPATAMIIALVALSLIFEPFPISGSAKDQITATVQLQKDHNILPAQQALLDLFATAPDLQMSTPIVILAPNRIVNYLVESIPYAEVIGGRGVENIQVYDQVDRFYMQGDQASPFLDADDLQLIAHWGIQLIVMQTDDARTAALFLQPQRFRLLHQVSGYLIFRVLDTQITAQDQVFKQMNSLYIQQKTQRWIKGDFDFSKPGSDGWTGFLKQWQTQLAASENDDLARYGAAASALLAGDNDQALAYWENLQTVYPQSSLIRQALAHTLIALEKSDQGRDLLLAALNDADDGTRMVAARTLLQPAFSPTLTPETVAQIAAAIDAAPETWNVLAVFDQPDAVRRYAAIFLAAGSLDAADAQLTLLTSGYRRPEDIEMRAQIQLAEHNIDGALALLKPSLDPDTYAGPASLQPDHWKINPAAGLYHLIEGDLAVRKGDVGAAMAAYQNATQEGMTVAADIFLARLQTAQGQVTEAQNTLKVLDNSGVKNAHFWSLVGQWELAQSTHNNADAQAVETLARQSMAVEDFTELPYLRSPLDTPANLQSFISDAKFDDNQTITVTAQFGQINLAPYEVKNWELIVFDPTTYHRYGDITLPALLVPGAITEWHSSVPLDSTYTPGKVGILSQAFNAFFRYGSFFTFIEPNSASANGEGSP